MKSVPDEEVNSYVVDWMLKEGKKLMCVLVQMETDGRIDDVVSTFFAPN